MTASSRIDIARLIDPRSVAVFGASDNKDKFGGRIMHYLTRHGYKGRVVPINPSRKEVLGLAAYPSIGAAPGPIDVAMLAVPAASLVASVRECAAAGVGACVIMTTGFTESGEPEGARREQELIAIVRETGMRVVGPNCMGLIIPRTSLALTSSLVLEIEAMRLGRIGLISQSGALMVSMFNKAHDAGIGFSACVSLGNQSDLEIADFLEWMVDDDGTDVICLYVEGLKNAGRFLRAAARAEAKGKPILMVKTGRTPDGERAARSHTASLAGSYAVLEAACRRHGVLLTDDPDGMVRAAELIRRWPPSAGDGIGILSSSGGGAGIGVDRVTEQGLRLAKLAPATKARLLDILLPPQADNPIDLGGRRQGDTMASAAACMDTLCTDPDVALQFVMLTTTPFYEPTTRELARSALSHGKPVVFSVTPGSAAAGPRRALAELDCPFFDSTDEALRAMRLYMARQRHLRLPARAAPERPAGLPMPSLNTLGAGRLTEPETKALIARYSVAVTREKLATTAEEAPAAADAIGYPVALKGVARDLVHKSDIGAVRLGLANAGDVRRAYDSVMAALKRDPSVGRIEGCLVQEMAKGEAEVIVGIRRDAQFGPVVLAGIGGIMVEITGDVQLALAPVDTQEAQAMLQRLRGWPLLAGVRGRPALDVEAVVDVICRLSWLATDLGPNLIDLEVNPLLVRPAGQGVIAVDGRASLG